MRFTQSDEVKVYVNRQVARMIEATGGKFSAHPRVQWRYRDIPVAQTDEGHLEWKIYRSDTEYPLIYWTVSITSDWRWIHFSHSNSDEGVRPLTEALLQNASIVDVQHLSEEGEGSLAKLLEYVVANFPPNHYGLS